VFYCCRRLADIYKTASVSLDEKNVNAELLQFAISKTEEIAAKENGGPVSLALAAMTNC
jgi:hypothetical protein